MSRAFSAHHSLKRLLTSIARKVKTRKKARYSHKLTSFRRQSSSSRVNSMQSRKLKLRQLSNKSSTSKSSISKRLTCKFPANSHRQPSTLLPRLGRASMDTETLVERAATWAFQWPIASTVVMLLNSKTECPQAQKASAHKRARHSLSPSSSKLTTREAARITIAAPMRLRSLASACQTTHLRTRPNRCPRRKAASKTTTKLPWMVQTTISSRPHSPCVSTRLTSIANSRISQRSATRHRQWTTTIRSICSIRTSIRSLLRLSNRLLVHRQTLRVRSSTIQRHRSLSAPRKLHPQWLSSIQCKRMDLLASLIGQLLALHTSQSERKNEYDRKCHFASQRVYRNLWLTISSLPKSTPLGRSHSRH